MIGIKIAETIVKPKPLSEVSSRNAEKIIIPPEKIKEMVNNLRWKILYNRTLKNI